MNANLDGKYDEAHSEWREPGLVEKISCIKFPSLANSFRRLPTYRRFLPVPLTQPLPSKQSLGEFLKDGDFPEIERDSYTKFWKDTLVS